jgi:hypothetical protein
MKREFAAIISSALLMGTALAGPIEQIDLPPPSTQHEQKPAAAEQNAMHEDWNAFSPADVWLSDIPESEGISLDTLAKKVKRYPSYNAVEERNDKLPTAYNWNRGNWRANFGTNVTTATASSSVIPTDIYAGNVSPSGGTGAIDGRLEYDVNAWQFYGGTRRSLVANPDGTLGVNNNFTGGTYYNLPPSLLGGKVGTGFEVNPVGDAKTRLEYRKMFGNTEGFLAAERTTPFQHSGPDVTGVNGLKAGINRKF